MPVWSLAEELKGVVTASLTPAASSFDSVVRLNYDLSVMYIVHVCCVIVMM